MKSISNLMRWLWPFGKLLIVIAIVVGVILWIRFQPVSVVVYQIEKGDVVAEVLGTGTLEARVQATVSPKIPGRLKQILVDEGDRVSAGQLLFELDDEELVQQVSIAEADVETKFATIDRLKTDTTRAAAVLKQASSNYKRLESLIQQNAVSREEIDKANEALAIAQSGVASADAAISEARKALVVSERNLEFQKTKLKDASVVAPFDGLIVRRQRDPGDVVVSGAPVLLLISTDQLWINAWVDETEMSGLKTGQTARVVFRSESEVNLPGKVVRLAKETDRETREFVVDVEVEKLPENWAVGQRAEVFIETHCVTNVTFVPTRFLANNVDQTGVFLSQNGISRFRPIEIGIRGREKVEVVSGLENGDLVILPALPNRTLKQGQRVFHQ